MKCLIKNVLIVVLVLLVVSLSIVGLKEFSAKNDWEALAHFYEVKGQYILDGYNDCLEENNHLITTFIMINNSVNGRIGG